MTLSNNDLSDILRDLRCARTNWYYIGLQLKESVDTLDAIRDRFTDPDDCLLAVITHWLKQIQPRPTWRALVIALKTHSIGEGQLASRLEREHCCSRSCGTEEPGRQEHVGVPKKYYVCMWEYPLCMQATHAFPPLL